MTTAINVDDYIKEYEVLHPPRKAANIPKDPSRRWWFMKSSDNEQECFDQCRFKLYQEAVKESGVDVASGDSINQAQWIIHARFASMQRQCSDMCADTDTQMYS